MSKNTCFFNCSIALLKEILIQFYPYLFSFKTILIVISIDRVAILFEISV
jgi:hypothetical protein